MEMQSEYMGHWCMACILGYDGQTKTRIGKFCIYMV